MSAKELETAAATLLRWDSAQIARARRIDIETALQAHLATHDKLYTTTVTTRTALPQSSVVSLQRLREKPLPTATLAPPLPATEPFLDSISTKTFDEIDSFARTLVESRDAAAQKQATRLAFAKEQELKLDLHDRLVLDAILAADQGRVERLKARCGDLRRVLEESAARKRTLLAFLQEDDAVAAHDLAAKIALLDALLAGL